MSRIDNILAENKKRLNKAIIDNGGYGFNTRNDAVNHCKNKLKKYCVPFPITKRELGNGPFAHWLGKYAPKGMSWAVAQERERWVAVDAGPIPATPTGTNTPTGGGTGGGGTGGGDTAPGGAGTVTGLARKGGCSCCGGKAAWTQATETKSWSNYCVQCGKSGHLAQGVKGDMNLKDYEWTCKACGADYCAFCGGDKSEKGKHGPGWGCEYHKLTVGGEGGDSSGGGQGEYSKFLSGDETFKDLINRICKQTDTLFLCKKSHIHITDIPSLYAQGAYLRKNAPTNDIAGILEGEDIKLWQLEDGSYTLNIDQYGFYNTVEVAYKGGKWVERHTDLVRVFGEKKVKYNHKDVDKFQAKSLAKAYLAANVRDFGLTVSAKVLHDGGIDIGDLVTLENPQTMKDYININEGRDAELMYVKGISVDWDGDSPLYNDLQLSFAPSNPENPEIAEVSGGLATPMGMGDALDQVGKLMEGITYANPSPCGTDYNCVASKKKADCHGGATFVQRELESRGISAEVREYSTQQFTGGVSNHRSTLYKDEKGVWQDFPYRNYPKIDKNFRNYDGSLKGRKIS
jgi:hypothetical protein